MLKLLKDRSSKQHDWRVTAANNKKCVERKFQGCESSRGAKVNSMELKFLEHSLLRSESSRGAKVPWNESSWTFRSLGANVPWNKSSIGAKVLSIYFSLPGTKVQRNDKARYHLHCKQLKLVPAARIFLVLQSWH